MSSRSTCVDLRRRLLQRGPALGPLSARSPGGGGMLLKPDTGNAHASRSGRGAGSGPRSSAVGAAEGRLSAACGRAGRVLSPLGEIGSKSSDTVMIPPAVSAPPWVRAVVMRSLRAMATITRITVTDDLDGGADDVQTVRFGWLGAEYELDLSAGNRERLQEVLVHYIAAARHVGGTRRPRRSRPPAASSNGDRTAEIRAWAVDHGHQVSDRGASPRRSLRRLRRRIERTAGDLVLTLSSQS